MIAPPSAHSPFTPAKRHDTSIFANISALRTPNFNVESQLLDKHWLVRMPPAPLADDIIDTVDKYYRMRWQTLLAVDEMIETIITQLKQLHFYENTYIVFASDNGFHMGQFSMPYDKRQPYETDIRIPFIVSGPGIQSKLAISHPVALIDLAPTIFDWIQLPKLDSFDGQSFADLLIYESNSVNGVEVSTDAVSSNTQTYLNDYYERQLLIEYWGEGSIETYSSECPWSEHDRLNVGFMKFIGRCAR